MSVSRESISKLMTELVDSFPMEADGRASISDFGKLLFAEGNAGGAATSASESAVAVKQEVDSAGDRNDEEEEDDDDDDDDDEDNDDEEEVDDEMTPSAGDAGAASNKRVFTEIKGVPRQKHHDVQCVVTDSGKIAISHGSMNKLMKSKDKAVPKRWTPEEDELLRQAVAKHGERNWKSIAEEVPGRNHTQCLQRWTKVLAPGLVKGHWRPDEDELLKELVAEGRKNWGQVANRIPGRTSKQCRERWYNHLDPSIVRGEYTAEEDRIVVEAQSRLGNKWSTIAAMLPGRTEDAVKIRWKSLCRVRKGQNRRNGTGDKPSKPSDDKPASMSSSSPSGFNGNLVKSEELRSFTTIPTQATPMGRVPMVQPSMMGVPTMVTYGSYGPMAAYPGGKAMMMTAVNQYGQPMMAVPSADYNPRGNVVNISSPSTGRAYRPVYATAAPPGSYSVVDANGNVYSHAPSYPGAVYRPAGTMMATHVHGQPTMVSSTYGYAMADGQAYYTTMHPGDQYAAAAQYNQSQASMQSMDMAQQQQQQQEQQQQQQQQQQHQYQQEGQPTNDQAASSDSKPPPPAPSLAAAFAQSLSHNGSNNNSSSTPKASSSSRGGGGNPAAMFAQSLGQSKTSSSNAKPPTNPAAMFAQNLAAKSTVAPSPVAAFLQKQNAENASSSSNTTPSSSSSSKPAPRPFNPAIAFAQHLAKPPMPAPSSASSVRSTDEDDGMSEDGDEPSLKKVKPRNSIDLAARASAARRMRTSGSGNSLMGRRSLDVFLNEIGDVGRISDLKMDEFQTMDELWRVSGDMDRLSL